MLRVYSVVTPAIAGGVASVTSPGLCGMIRGVSVRFSGAPAGTVTATIKHSGGVAAPVDEIALNAVAAANRMYQPLKPGQVPAGTDMAGTWTPYALNGQILFAIAGAAAANGQTVTFAILVEE